MYVFATAILGVYTLFSFAERDISMNKYAIVAALMGVGSIIGTLAVIKGVEIAPNPGYVMAVFSANAIIVTVLSPFIYGSEISPMNLLGVVIVVFGISLLVL